MSLLLKGGRAERSDRLCRLWRQMRSMAADDRAGKATRSLPHLLSLQGQLLSWAAWSCAANSTAACHTGKHLLGCLWLTAWF